MVQVSRSSSKNFAPPGSTASQLYLERAGLLKELEALEFGIVGFRSTTCISNAGSLYDEVMAAIKQGHHNGGAIRKPQCSR